MRPPTRSERAAIAPRRKGRARSLALPLLALGLAAGLAGLLGLGAHATYGARVTADEPQYLLTALSLGRQADLDIRDEIAGEAYRPFHRADLDPQTTPVDAAGRQFSPHDPLLPALLAAPVRLGGWVGAKATMAVLAAALAMLTAWTAIRRAHVRTRTAVLVTGAFACTPPLAVYGTQIYPEVPAALAVMAAVAAILGPMGRTGRAVVVVSLTALPWLSVKFAPVAATLFGVAVWRVWRPRAQDSAVLLRPWRAVLSMALPLTLMAVLYAVVHRRVYGGWTPYASGDYFAKTGELTVIGNDPDYLGRSRRLVGLLVDRSFGLGVWMPAWLLLAPAVAVALATPRTRRLVGPFLAPALTGWIVATFLALTMHGWWWPGRQVVVVLPLLVVVVAVATQRCARWLGPAIAVGAIYGLVAWAWIALDATRRRRTLVVDFDQTGNPLVRLLRVALPDGRAAGGDSARLLLWAVVLVCGSAMSWWLIRKHGDFVDGS